MERKRGNTRTKVNKLWRSESRENKNKGEKEEEQSSFIFSEDIKETENIQTIHRTCVSSLLYFHPALFGGGGDLRFSYRLVYRESIWRERSKG